MRLQAVRGEKRHIEKGLNDSELTVGLAGK